MRNLVQYVASKLQTSAVSPLPIQRIAFSEDVVAVCFASDEMAAVHLWSPKEQWFSECEWPLPEEGLKCVGLHYDSIDLKAIAVFSNGDFVECVQGEAVVAGSLETEISACEWSPTGELACVVLKNNEVLVISTDFEASEADVVIGKHQMTVADLDLANNHVSVGWGKKETQFQGRGARQEQRMQDPTTIQAIESREPLEGTSDEVSVSWRGDGQYVVVNSCIEGNRALRMLNSMGQLESVSEPATHLSGVVAWEPKGGLIATVRPNQIQFFERNGLKRYTFDIDNSSTVCQLAWSTDSSVLSIAHTSGEIHLYTMKNWHWYRKQTLQFGSNALVKWHPEMPCTMGVVENEQINFFTWRLTPSTDGGLAAVIDRNKVMVTPIDRCGIPPPMALAEYEFSSQPIAVAVKFPSTVVVATVSNEVHLLELEGPRLKQVGEISGVTGKYISFDTDGNIVMYTGESIRLGFDQAVEFPADQVSVLKGDFYLRGSQLCALNSTSIYDFGEPCVDFVVSPSGGGFFGLSRSQKLLHSSGKVLANGVTSMLSTEDHLLYTTLNTLKFVHLHTDAALAASTSGAEQSREIERGSWLVTAMPHKMAVVLQAVRGNLETIYPRMFVLGEVRKLVALNDYLGAFKVCRVHRIDMNLLYDLNPTQFASEVKQIVEQLGTEIDLFMSALGNVDVTKAMYLDTANVATNESTPADNAVEGKVNFVLDLVRPYLLPQNKITSWCLRQPPAYVEALQCAAKSPQLIKHLLVLCDADTLYKTALSVYEPKLALVVAQQAQMDPKEYIPFLRARDHENEFRSKFNIDLFLRQYESAVVHLIGDPNASSSEISEFTIRHKLHSLALTKLRSSNNKHEEAEREILLSQAELWSDAGENIKAGVNYELLGDHQSALESYILGSNWQKAMSLVTPGSEEENSVAQRLAEVTEFGKQYGDCALIHLRYLKDPQRAVEFYCLGNHFDEAVLVARNHQLAQKLDDLLRESFGSFQELLADFSSQVPSQLKRLRHIREKRKEDLLGFERQQQQLESGMVDPSMMEGLAVDDNLSIAGSDATTSASVYTKYTDKTGASTGTAATNATRRTLKNQRRQDRKKARGKKGSVYEEDYLIASTTRLVNRLKESRADLQSLVIALTRCQLVFYATKLSDEYTKVVNMLLENLDEIYLLDDEARVRFDASGFEYLADQPEKPILPPAEL